MVVGKIISIFDISIEVILNSDTVKIGDILSNQDDKKYTFEVPVGTESIQIRLSHPSSNRNNTRVDNLVLSVN